MAKPILTIGHSNHPLERFLALLAQHEIEALVDIRRFPGSKKHPHFHRDNLAATLPNSGVEYHWLETLGGRRSKQRDKSPNLGLVNRGFRNYADYMLTNEFPLRAQTALKKPCLVKIHIGQSSRKKSATTSLAASISSSVAVSR